LSDLYNRQEDLTSLDGYLQPIAPIPSRAGGPWRIFSESFPSENGSSYLVSRTGWGYDAWRLDWTRAYTYIRELNLFLARDSASTGLAAADRARFMRKAVSAAIFYFEMARRMGGFR